MLSERVLSHSNGNDQVLTSRSASRSAGQDSVTLSRAQNIWTCSTLGSERKICVELSSWLGAVTEAPEVLSDFVLNKRVRLCNDVN